MQFLGPKEIAALVGVHERTVVRLFATGELPAFKVGPKLWRTTREAFDAWVKEKLQPSRRNSLTAPALPLRVLMRDRDRESQPIRRVNGSRRV